MSELFINTTLYYVLAVIIYLYIAVTSILLISAGARNFTSGLLNKLNTKLPKPDAIIKAVEYSSKFFIKPISRFLKVIFSYLIIVSAILYRAEEYFISVVLPELAEPVNYASLLLRKCYTNSQTAAITVLAVFFVVFYFILSIF